MSLAKLLARGYKQAGKGKLRRPDGKVVSEARAVAGAKRAKPKAAAKTSQAARKRSFEADLKKLNKETSQQAKSARNEVRGRPFSEFSQSAIRVSRWVKVNRKKDLETAISLAKKSKSKFRPDALAIRLGEKKTPAQAVLAEKKYFRALEATQNKTALTSPKNAARSKRKSEDARRKARNRARG